MIIRTQSLLLQQLHQATHALREMDNEKNFPYSSFEEFVLKYGQSYRSQPLPSRYKSGQPKMCFANSLRMAERHRTLTYVEGYRHVPFARDLPPVQHAWCVDESGKVHDRTLGYDPESEFFGVPFKLSYVWEMLKLTGQYSILEQTAHGVPVFYAEPKEFLSLQQDSSQARSQVR